VLSPAHYGLSKKHGFEKLLINHEKILYYALLDIEKLETNFKHKHLSVQEARERQNLWLDISFYSSREMVTDINN